MSFSHDFWSENRKWLCFVRKNMVKSMYIIAHVLEGNPDKHVLMLFISGDDGRKLIKFS